MLDGLLNVTAVQEGMIAILDVIEPYVAVSVGVWLALLAIGVFLEMWRGRG